MAEVIVIKGAVTYPITLDPGVWIFDERKINIANYRETAEDEQLAEEQAYLKGTGAHWDRELHEGVTPLTQRTSLTELRQTLDADYGMKLSIFLNNAQVSPEATTLRVHRENGDFIDIPLTEAKKAILQFAKAGKPIRKNGPVYFYLPSQIISKEKPIDSVVAFELI